MKVIEGIRYVTPHTNKCSCLVRYLSTQSPRISRSRATLKDSLRRMREEQGEKTPCFLRLRRSEYKCLAYLEADPDPCQFEKCKFKPIDEEAYSPSDKTTRNYQKTWCEFKPLPRMKPRVRKIFPDLERRNTEAFRNRQCTACEPENCELPKSPRAPPEKLFEPITMPWPCCKFSSVTCCSKRSNYKCNFHPPPSCCVKRKTQYQSFSECKREPLLPPISACECDQKPSMCEVWNFWRTKR